MTLRTLKLLAAVGVVSVASSAVAQDAPKAKLPTADQAVNQKLAETVAMEIGKNPATAAPAVRVMTDGGVVTLVGPCKDDAQKTAILEAVRVINGVTLVRDGLTVNTEVKQTQAVEGGPRLSPAPSAVPPSMPVAAVGNPMVEPLPLGPAGGGAAMGGSPPLPPYAWPTYAPYPNMSRVAYPTAYPYNAFPYIGPFYPFPKVPLGWRSVTLSWEDGHWWLGRKQSPADYWRVKFGY